VPLDMPMGHAAQVLLSFYVPILFSLSPSLEKSQFKIAAEQVRKIRKNKKRPRRAAGGVVGVVLLMGPDAYRSSDRGPLSWPVFSSR
jgi:hypothetical protein